MDNICDAVYHNVPGVGEKSEFFLYSARRDSSKSDGENLIALAQIKTDKKLQKFKKSLKSTLRISKKNSIEVKIA